MKPLHFIESLITWFNFLMEGLVISFANYYKPGFLKLNNYYKNTCIGFFLFAFLHLPATTCPAQQVTFNRLSLPEGSHFGLVNGICQDSLGYMWFAAYGRGLHRYDGYHTINYMNDPLNTASLVSNNLEAIYAGHNNIIWIGTQESGLDRLDASTGMFTHFKYKKEDPASLSDDRVTTILEDHEGTLWVGTKNGLNRLNQKTGTFTRYMWDESDSASLSCNRVQVLYEDRHSTLWVGTASRENFNNTSSKGGLNRFDKKTGKFIRYQHNPNNAQSLIDNRIGAIFEDSKENFWVYTVGDGLHKMDREKGVFEQYQYNSLHPEKLSGPPRKKSIHPNLNLFFIQEDAEGAIWMGASGGWITRYNLNTKKVTHFDSFNGDIQSMEAVSGAFTSREGILWIRSWVGKIYQVNAFQGNFQHFTTGSISHSIREDAAGVIWIGTFQDGLLQNDRVTGSVRRFSSLSPGPNDLKDLYIDAIYEENDSILWMGSNKALNRYNRNTKRFTRYVHDSTDVNTLFDGNIVDILEDKPGSLWIATGNSLDHFDIKSKTFRHYLSNPKDSNSLSNNNVISLLKDHAGNLWIGCADGSLNYLDMRSRKVKRFRCGQGLISSMAEDFEHIIWVGTSNGLYRSNPGVDSFLWFSDPRIVITSATLVTAILEDDQKNLWVASSAGILRLSSTRKEISLYNKNQGVDASGFSFFLMRGAKGRNGEFFFGDQTGYYAFYPGQFKSNSISPQIVISDFRLADKQVKPRKGSVLPEPITQVTQINLNYNQNFFSFDFAAIHFSSPEDNQHFYILENLENNWRKAGFEKKAYYSNVPPGKYIFRVKATNSDGVWAEKAIVIVINPPWYLTWWAYSLSAVVFLVTLWSFIKWREGALKKERIVLAEKVAIRTRELRDEKERVEEALSELEATQMQLIQSEKTASLSKLQQAMLNERLRISRELHDDIGSTLSGIVLYSHMAENQVQAQRVNEVENSLNIIKQSANNMVNRLNDLVWAINPEHSSLKNLMQKLEEYALEMAAVKNIKVKADVPGSLGEIQFPAESLHNIYLLAKEAINNAIKYSHASLLELNVRRFDHTIEFVIMDNGKGFDMALVKKGNGLLNMHKRADEAAAILSIQSGRDGTLISLQCKIT